MEHTAPVDEGVLWDGIFSVCAKSKDTARKGEEFFLCCSSGEVADFLDGKVDFNL